MSQAITAKAKDNSSKWTERKWLIGLSAFVIFIFGSFIEANSGIIFPIEVKGILGGIVATWLVTEGLLDSQRIKIDAEQKKK